MMTARSRRPWAGPIAACLAAAILCACGSRPSETKSTDAATRGASAKDLAAISRVHQEYVAAHNDADADRLVALFTDDAVLMPMDEPSLSGKEAIKEHYEEFFDQSPSAIELSPVETRVAGEWAFERIQVKVTLPDGAREERHADVKYLWILQRQPDGSWKIARAIYNLDGNIDEVEGAVARAGRRRVYPNRPEAKPVCQAIRSPKARLPAPATARSARPRPAARRSATTNGADSTRLISAIPTIVPVPNTTR